MTSFEAWWNEIGSGLGPVSDDDFESFGEYIARVSWRHQQVKISHLQEERDMYHNAERQWEIAMAKATGGHDGTGSVANYIESLKNQIKIGVNGMKLTELAQAMEDEKPIEAANCDGAWFTQDKRDVILMAWMQNPNSVRIKPEKKPIDLSVLIQSGIDCVFWDGSIGVLSEISSAPQYHMRVGTEKSHGYTPYSECRPRMNYWHNWQGGDCPIPEGLAVLVTYRSGREHPIVSGSVIEHRWEHTGSPLDIIAFKVVGVIDTHCMPWELDK